MGHLDTTENCTKCADNKTFRFIMILSILGALQLSCKNLAGSKVDWFLQFK